MNCTLREIAIACKYFIDELRDVWFSFVMQTALIQTSEEADRFRLVMERVIRQVATPKVAAEAAKREGKLEDKLDRGQAETKGAAEEVGQ